MTDLTAGQLSGEVCTVCGVPFAESGSVSIPVEHGSEGQLFACLEHARAAEEDE